MFGLHNGAKVGTILSYNVQGRLPEAPIRPPHTEEMAALPCDELLSRAARQRLFSATKDLPGASICNAFHGYFFQRL